MSSQFTKTDATKHVYGTLLFCEETPRNVVVVEQEQPRLDQDGGETIIRIWSKEKQHVVWGCELSEFPDRSGEVNPEGFVKHGKMMIPLEMSNELLRLRKDHRDRTWKHRPNVTLDKSDLQEMGDCIGSWNVEVMVPHDQAMELVLTSHVKHWLPESVEVYVGKNKEVYELNVVGSFDENRKGWMVTYHHPDKHERFNIHQLLRPDPYRITLDVVVQDDGKVRYRFRETKDGGPRPSYGNSEGLFGYSADANVPVFEVRSNG